MVQEFKEELRQSRHPRRRSQSPPPEREYISYPPLNANNNYDHNDEPINEHSNKHNNIRAFSRPFRPSKKKVRWGPVMILAPLPPPRYYSPRSPIPGLRPSKSILKSPTRLDREMFRVNMWRLVNLAENRLEYTYECIGDMRGMGAHTLNLIINSEDRSLSNALTQKVLESASELDNLSLETNATRSHRQRRFGRRRTSRH